MGEFKHNIRYIGDITIIVFYGNLQLECLDELEKMVNHLLSEPSTNKIVVDLSNVKLIDSIGIGNLVFIYKTMLARKGKFGIINPNETVTLLFAGLGLTKIFSIFKDHDEAVAAMSSGEIPG